MTNLIKLNRNAAFNAVGKLLADEKFGKTKNADRLRTILELLNEDGSANLEKYAQAAFPDAKNPLNSLSTMAQTIEKKARILDFNLEIKRDGFTKKDAKERILWFEGDDVLTERVLEKQIPATEQPVSEIKNLAKPYKKDINLCVCYCEKDKSLVEDLIEKLKDAAALSRDYSFDVYLYDDALAGDQIKARIKNNLLSANLLLIVTSAAFYSDEKFKKHYDKIIEQFLDRVAICKISVHDEIGGYFAGRKMMTFGKNGKCYSQIKKNKKIEFAEQLSKQIQAKLDGIEDIEKNLSEIYEEKHQERVEKLAKGIDAFDKSDVANTAEPVKLGTVTYRKKDSTFTALELLEDWLDETGKTHLFAMLGQYGMGKTFTSKAFASQQIQKYKDGLSKFIPIYFDLRDLNVDVVTNPDTEIWDIVAAMLKKRKAADDKHPLTAKEIENIWVNHPTLIIFDGLDEVTTHLAEGQKENFFISELLKLVPNFHSKYSSAIVKEGAPERKMLLTCRTDYFRSITQQSSYFSLNNRDHINPNKDYASCNLLPFSIEQVKVYLKQTFPDRNADKLYEMLEEIHNLAEMSSRPVLLDFLTAIVDDLEQILISRSSMTTADVYEHILQKSFDRDNAKHEIPISIKTILLEEVAALLWNKAQRRIDFDDLTKFITEYMSIASAAMKKLYFQLEEETLYKDLRNATLLVRSSDKDFGFSHTSVQEFFLAKFILRKLKEGNFKALNLKKVNKETLDFLMDLWLGLDKEDIALIKKYFDLSFTETGTDCRILMLEIYQRDHHRNKILLKPNNLDLSNLTFENYAIKGLENDYLDLSGSNFKNSNFYTTDLEYLNLDNANFKNSTILNSKIQNSSLNGSNFNKTQVAAKFREINALDVQAKKADFSYSIFSKSEWNSNNTNINNLNTKSTLNAKSSDLKTNHKEGHFNVVNKCFHLGDNKVLSCSDDNTLILWDLKKGNIIQHLKGHNDTVLHCVDLGDNKALSCSDDNTLILWDLKKGNIIQHLKGHESYVNHCVNLGDNKVLSSSYDNTLILWDLNTGSITQHFKGHTKWVRHCVDLGDNKALSCSDDNTLILWDLKNGNIIQHLKGHNDTVLRCVDLGDNKALSCSNDNTLILWDLKKGSIIQRLKGHTDWVRHCVHLGDNKALSCSDDNTLILWDLKKGNIIQHLKGHNDAVLHCVHLGDNKAISCSNDNTLILWDLKNGSIIQHLKGHNNWVKHCVDLGDNKAISSSSDNTLILWDLNKGNIIQHLKGHKSYVNYCVHLGENKVLSCSDDNTLILWDLKKGNVIQHLKGHKSYVNHCVDLGDNRVLSCSYDNTLILWDLKNGNIIRHLKGHKSYVNRCVYLGNNKALSCSYDNTLILWDLNKGSIIRHLKGHNSYVNHCVDLGDNKVLSCSYDNTLILWDLKNGNIIQHLKGHKSYVNHCVDLGDNKALSCSYDNTLILWDLNNGNIIQHLKGHKSYVNHCVDLGNNKALSCSDDNTLILWDLNKGTIIQHLKGHTNWVRHCVYLGDNKVLSCSSDNTLILWDLITGEMIRQFFGHQYYVLKCAYLGGDNAMSWGGDGAVKFWSLKTGQETDSAYHFGNQEYAFVKNGIPTDLSKNAWEYLHWEKLDEQGNIVGRCDFDEVDF